MEKILETKTVTMRLDRDNYEKVKQAAFDYRTSISEIYRIGTESSIEAYKKYMKNLLNPRKKPVKSNPDSDYNAIINYLNQAAGKSFRVTDNTKSLIDTRLKEFSVKDFYIVIDNMCQKWRGSDMEQYLRPTTLFSGKFDSYLNIKSKKRKSLMSMTEKELREYEKSSN